MIASRVASEFASYQTNVAGRPIQPNQGTTVTPGNNAYGAYASLGLTLTSDAWGIWININNIGANTFATDTILTIGVDPAGGTSFVDTIPDLLCSGACPYGGSQTANGVWFYFPILIKSGSSLGAKASQNNASPRAASVYVICPSQPSHPELLKMGSFVRSYGITSASSSGTAATAGTISDGAYVQLSSGIADPCWFWQLAMGFNNSAWPAVQVFHADLLIGAAGPVGRNVLVDVPIGLSTVEQLSAYYAGAFAQAAVNDQLWARCQSAGAGSTGLSLAAYGVGG